MSGKVRVWCASVSFSLMKWMPLVVLGLMIVLEAILFPLSYVADLDAAMFSHQPQGMLMACTTIKESDFETDDEHVVICRYQLRHNHVLRSRDSCI